MYGAEHATTFGVVRSVNEALLLHRVAYITVLFIVKLVNLILFFLFLLLYATGCTLSGEQRFSLTDREER